MSATIVIDTADFSRLSRNLHNLPDDLKRKAFHAAAKRVLGTAKAKLVRELAANIKIQQRAVRDRTTTPVSSGGELRIIVRSKQIPLHELGARQTRKGVTVRLRGSYKSAFLATMKSGHTGVFKNTGGFNSASGRNNAIKELYGPNPAHAMSADRTGKFQALAEAIVEENLMPRILHEIDFRITRLNAR